MRRCGVGALARGAACEGWHAMRHRAVRPLRGRRGMRCHELLRHGNQLWRLSRLPAVTVGAVPPMAWLQVHDWLQNHFHRYTFHHRQS